MQKKPSLIVVCVKTQIEIKKYENPVKTYVSEYSTVFNLCFWPFAQASLCYQFGTSTAN